MLPAVKTPPVDSPIDNTSGAGSRTADLLSVGNQTNGLSSGRRPPLVLFDMGHPADVHLFKNLIWELRQKGIATAIACRPRDNMRDLLDQYGFRYHLLGHYESLGGKMWGLFTITMRLWRLCQQLRPSFLVNFGSPYAQIVSRLSHCPTLCLADTEPQPGTLFYWQFRLLLQPLVKKIFLPRAFQGSFHAPRVVRFSGSKELAYLHPRYFQPDPAVLESIPRQPGKPLILVKFAAWDAIHDVHFQKQSPAQGRAAFVRELQKLGQVLVSTEVEDPALAPLTVRVTPGDMHHLLAFCDLYIGEGATMAAEAGVLGVPWIFIYPHSLGYLQEQQKRFGLGWQVPSRAEAIHLARQVLAEPRRKILWQQKRTAYLQQAEDLTQLMLKEVLSQLNNSGRYVHQCH